MYNFLIFESRVHCNRTTVTSIWCDVTMVSIELTYGPWFITCAFRRTFPRFHPIMRSRTKVAKASRHSLGIRRAASARESQRQQSTNQDWINLTSLQVWRSEGFIQESYLNTYCLCQLHVLLLFITNFKSLLAIFQNGCDKMVKSGRFIAIWWKLGSELTTRSCLNSASTPTQLLEA
jgi:hypothetical protein